MPQLVGVVLAGGRGKRLGCAKGELLVGGRTLAQNAAGALWPLCGTVLISLGAESGNPAPEHTAVMDLPPGDRGPLAGIQAAFAASGRADLLVLACDYPVVDTSVLRTVVESSRQEDDLIMPTDASGRDHPLVGLWRRRTEAKVLEALENRFYKVRGLLADLVVRRLGPAHFPGRDLNRVLANVNTPEELNALLGR
jgi:molybdopterin-guanine dinucleotide biosynthesis protein A